MIDTNETKKLLVENHINIETIHGGTSLCKKITSATLYGLSSIALTIINKTILTTYQFPSFLVLSIGQIIATILTLYIAKKLNILTYPDFTANLTKKIFPLPLIYIGNMIFGLGGTQTVNLPMFAVLRSFAIFLTMLLELIILAVWPKILTQISVYLMIGGSILAANNDLTFNIEGYSYVMITNLLAAANVVVIKKKLDIADMDKNLLMFYNSLFVIVPTIIVTWIIGDFHKVVNEFSEWHNAWFAIIFLLSCFMGLLLMYSIMLCTEYNSALTTTYVGCLKNICITYMGMFIGGDYIFTWLNYVGINISIIGSLLYAYVTFR